jgi:hypothetical protein
MEQVQAVVTVDSGQVVLTVVVRGDVVPYVFRMEPAEAGQMAAQLHAAAARAAAA